MIMRITNWSKVFRAVLYLSANHPKRLLSSMPIINGKSTCKQSLPMMLQASKLPVSATINSPTQSGVINKPTRLEILALKMAAGILPLAIETITTDEETVEGKAAR